MLPVEYEWESVGEPSAWMQIQKTDGRLFWNMKVQQYLGSPNSVQIDYDDEENCISVTSGNDFAVVKDEDGNFYVEAKTALEECGLVFPLAEHITDEPDAPINSHNRVIMALS